jgi:hypothetical protein
MISYAVGDASLERSVIKLETGKIGGFSAYLSRSKTDSDLWRGADDICSIATSGPVPAPDGEEAENDADQPSRVQRRGVSVLYEI